MIKKFKSGLPFIFLVITFCSLIAIAFVILFNKPNTLDKKEQQSVYKTAGFPTQAFIPTASQKTVSFIFTGDVIPARSGLFFSELK